MEFHNRNIVNAKIESRIQIVTIELLYIRYIKFTQYLTVIKIKNKYFFLKREENLLKK